MIKPDAQERFILAVLKGGHPDPGTFGALSLTGVLDTAVREGVFYPFYKELLRGYGSVAFLPEGVRERFKQTYYLHAAKSSVFMLQVSRVFSCLESRAIDALLFKGPAVDSSIYDDYWRPRLDIDIAVKPADMPALEKALQDSGYAAPRGAGDYPIPEYLNSRLFTPVADELVPVHVHRHLVNNMFLTVDGFLQARMEEVWGQTKPFKDYRHIFTLSPEMNIIYLCEHGLKHDLDQLIYLYEIWRMILSYGRGFDWEKFLLLARTTGLGRAAYWALYFVKAFFEPEIPGNVLAELRPDAISAGERRFERNTRAFKRRRYASYPVYVAMRRGIARKILFIFRTIFPPAFGLRGYLERLSRILAK